PGERRDGARDSRDERPGRDRPGSQDERDRPGDRERRDVREDRPGDRDRRDGRDDRRGADRRDMRDDDRDPRSGQLDDLREGRRESREGGRTVIREPGGRTIIRENGRTIIRREEAGRFRYGATDVRTERRGSETVVITERAGGVQIVTYTDAEGRLLRRARRGPDGREVVIIDNRVRGGGRPGDYFVRLPPPVVGIPRERYILEEADPSYERVSETLLAPPVERLSRRYTLDEVRYSPEVRARMPRVDLDTITFETGSWTVTPEQAQRLAVVARALTEAITRNPQEVFLIEGHTDAVGADDDNLSLSDRRAESVAVALQDTFRVPPENLTTQGYGEQQLKVATQGPERRNRRVTVRRITPLLTGDAGPPAR
ncbi:OmpA family protein, partial [Enterovirga sp.]|uniref:OmpA family protein n=1 Tax=Enterovirga sp. TaxID=2026350 RepID=UPI00262D6D83